MTKRVQANGRGVVGKQAVSSTAPEGPGDLERRRNNLIEPGMLSERNPVFAGYCSLCGWPCKPGLTVCPAHADLVSD